MAEFFESLLNGIDPIIAYIILFLSAFAENVIPPIPGDTVVVVGAYLVSIGKLSFWGVFISTCLGSSAGFMVMYYLGAIFGRKFFYKKSRSKIFKEKQIQKVEKWFAKWGYWVIFANRFLSGTRSVVSVFAGLVHLNAFYVFVLGFTSTMIWNGLLISLGMILGHNWNELLGYISRYNTVFFGITIIVLILLFSYRFLKKRNRSIDEEHSSIGVPRDKQTN
jgi:membrane protein DedA with SNARE-associated domain